jgi:hypothetical protein
MKVFFSLSRQNVLNELHSPVAVFFDADAETDDGFGPVPEDFRPDRPCLTGARMEREPERFRLRVGFASRPALRVLAGFVEVPV